MSENGVGAGGRLEKDNQPSAIDTHVGRRIRQRRTFLGISEENLGDQLGLTAQQVQKYESGAIRVGASRLFDMSRIMDVPISFFFEDMPESAALGYGVSTMARISGFAEPQEGFGDDDSLRQEAIELIHAYFRIADPAVRERILELVRSLAKD